MFNGSFVFSRFGGGGIKINITGRHSCSCCTFHSTFLFSCEYPSLVVDFLRNQAAEEGTCCSLILVNGGGTTYGDIQEMFTVSG
jgi:hypothetical protein